MSDIEQKEPIEYKLLIEFVYQKKRRFFKTMKHLVQNKPFKFGLRVKNIDDKNSPKGKIKNLSLRSGEIVHGPTEEFAFPELNPGQEIILWWPDELVTVIKGETWIHCYVEPEDKTKVTFATFQYNSHCCNESRFKERNAWGDALLIRGELEQQQAKTNYLICVLTALVFLDGVWGLDIISKGILNSLGWLFSQIGWVLSQMG